MATSDDREPLTAADPVKDREPVTYRYKFDGVEFDEAAAALKLDGQPVSLEPRPMRLLAELLHHLNEVVTREELFESVWDGRPTVDNVLANAVNKLRKAMGELAAQRLITVPRIGYRLAGPVERVATRVGLPPDPVLRPGLPVPGREGFVLERALGNSVRSQVWLARHAKLATQRVFKFATDADSLRALKREFTLYRVLNKELGERDDITRLLDSNFAEPPFFIECEYGGQDLADWAPDHLAGIPQADRLKLFLQIALAVAAAHRVGVLHKDLKPSNILVMPDTEIDGGWRARLTDFGSGRALDLERLRALELSVQGMTITQHVGSDSLTGTPLYLAPELLAGGPPSMQSDLYALGLILFQMLVGDLRRPLASGWQREVPDELLREDIAASTDGAATSRLPSVSTLITNLEHLEQRKADRDKQAADADALRRLATAQSLRSARRPWLMVSAAALLMGVVGTAGFAWRADQARSEAVAQAARAQAINDFLNRDLLPATDVTRAGSGKAVTMTDVITRAAEQAGKRFAADPQVEASVRCQLGSILVRSAGHASAVNQFERAVNLLQPIRKPDDEELLKCRFGLAQAQALNYRLDQAEAELKRAESDAGSRLLRDPNGLVVAAFTAKHEVQSQLKQTQESLLSAQRLVAAVDAWPGADLSDRFLARQRLAETHLRMGDEASARPLLQELSREPYAAETVGAISYARVQISRGTALTAQGKPNEAIPVLTSAREVLTSALGPTAYHVGLANYELANAYSMMPDSQRAMDCLRLALAAFTASLGPEHGHTISIEANLAISDLNLGHAPAAVKALARVVPLFKALGSPTDSLSFYQAIGLSDLGRFGEAAEILSTVDPDRLVDAHNSGDGSGAKAYVWRLMAEKGRAMFGLKQPQRGRLLLREALAGMKREGAPKEWLPHYRALLSGRPKNAG